MNIKWMLAGAAVLVVGAGTPWAVGVVTEQQWQDATREVNASQPFFQLETHQYNRRLFGAEFDGTVRLQDPATGEVHELNYRGHATHGVTGSLLDFSPQEELSAFAAELFPEDKPRLTLETRVWGTVTLELKVPAINALNEETGESFNMSESWGRATITDGGNAADITLLWPGAVVRAPGTRISIEDFRLEQTVERLRGDVWIGDGDMALSGFEVAAEDHPPLRLDGFAIQSETKAVDGGERISSQTVMSLETVTTEGESFGPHRLEFVLNDINVDGWNRFMGAVTTLQTMGMDPSVDPQVAYQQQIDAMNEINEAAHMLAANGFSVGFPAISLATPEGEIAGEAMISHPRLSDEEKAEMLMVMQKLTGKLDMSLPVALAEKHPQLMLELMPLVDQGMVVQDGERFRLEATLKDLAVDVNGNVIPLPPMI